MRAGPFSISLDFAIRLCRADDLPKLEWFGVFRDHREIIRQTFARQIAGDVLMFVADARGFPVAQAWIDLRPDPRTAYPTLWAVRVMEPLQGLGIGGRLMGAAEQAAKRRGHRGLALNVERSNLRARAFYESRGWRVVGNRHGSFLYTTPEGRTVVQPLDEFIMEKPLDQSPRAIPRRA